MNRENPATMFIAHSLAEHVEKLPWDDLGRDARRYWLDAASRLVIGMYESGFTIPQPTDPDAVWRHLGAQG